MSRHLSTTTPSTFRARGWVVLAALLIFSSLFTYAATRPSSILGATSAGDPTYTTVGAPATASVDTGVDIVVIARDEYDEVINDGTARDVTISTDLDGALSPVVFSSSLGTYTAHLNDNALRTHEISATINGQPLTMDPISIEFVPGAPAGLAFTPMLASPKTADDTFATAVTVYDQFGNEAPSTVVSVTLSGATIGGDVSNDTVLGVAEFTGLSVRQVGNYIIEATGSFADDPLDGDILDITPGKPAVLVFTVEPPDGTADDTFGATVTVEDAWGNTTTDRDVDVTLSGAPFDAGDVTVTSVSGIATFTGLEVHTADTYTITASASFETVQLAADTSELVVLPGALDHFDWGEITPSREAGETFEITATSYDQYDNIKTNYTGNGAQLTSTLTNSPNGTANVVPSNLTWTNGTGTADVKPVKATLFVAGVNTSDQTFTITASVADDSKTKTSDAFAVQPASLNDLSFAPVSLSPVTFSGGQPLDTKVSGKIYSSCVAAAVGSADPCTSASTPVKVLATDEFGNRIPNASIGVTTQPVASSSYSGTFTGTTPVSTATGSGPIPLGEAWFDDLSITSISGLQTDRYVLRASSGSVTKGSASFRIVSDLAQCNGQTTCVNTATTNASQVSFSYSKAEEAYGGVAATTNFSDPTLDVNGQCAAGRTGPTIGSAFDMRIIGDTTGSPPTTTMFTSIKLQTLKNLGISARNADVFNVCLGALYLDGADTGNELSAKGQTRWTGKDKRSKASAAVAAPDADGLWRQWAVPADCGQKYLSTTYDPCIAVKTKSPSVVAAQLTTLTGETWTVARVNSELKFFDGDIGIFIRKPFPWDGKGGSY